MLVGLRVDHRLLHGQVAFSWTSALGADCILIANTAVTNDNLRKTAIKMKIPYMTNIAAANAAVEGILEAEIHGIHEVKSLQEYHKAIKD